MLRSLVGSEMCIRDRTSAGSGQYTYDPSALHEIVRVNGDVATVFGSALGYGSAEAPQVIDLSSGDGFDIADGSITADNGTNEYAVTADDYAIVPFYDTNDANLIVGYGIAPATATETSGVYTYDPSAVNEIVSVNVATVFDTALGFGSADTSAGSGNQLVIDLGSGDVFDIAAGDITADYGTATDGSSEYDVGAGLYAIVPFYDQNNTSEIVGYGIAPATCLLYTSPSPRDS